MFSLIFLECPRKEVIITASFVERPLKQHCLAYRDYEITLLTFRIMKLKIDAYIIFLKLLSKISYQFRLS